MTELEAKHRVNRLADEPCNAVKVACRNHFGLDHPGAAAAYYLIKRKVIVDVCGAYSARWHKGYSAVGSRHRLYHRKSARLLGREKLDRFKTEFKSRLDTRRVVDSGNNWAAALQAVFDYLGVEAGGHDEFCARLNGVVNLCLCQHGSRADYHFGVFFSNRCYRFLCARGAEGDLGAGKSAVDKCLRERLCVSGVVDFNDRDNADP